MNEADQTIPANVNTFWRRAVNAIANAFEAARGGGDGDTVFQTIPARERAEPRPEAEDPLRPAPTRIEEILQ